MSKETVTIYRVVGPAELASIQSAKAFTNIEGLEVKYFTTDAQEAARYAQMAVKKFGDPAYTMVSTQVPKSILNLPNVAVTVDGGIPAFVIPNAYFKFMIPKVLDHSPLPVK